MGTAAPLSILLDECVQKAAVKALEDDGYDVARPRDSGERTSPSDSAVLDLAVRQGRILVTTDTDFVGIHGKWVEAGREHLGIVIGQQDPHLKRFLRNLRRTLRTHDRSKPQRSAYLDLDLTGGRGARVDKRLPARR